MQRAAWRTVCRCQWSWTSEYASSCLGPVPSRGLDIRAGARAAWEPRQMDNILPWIRALASGVASTYDVPVSCICHATYRCNQGRQGRARHSVGLVQHFDCFLGRTARGPSTTALNRSRPPRASARTASSRRPRPPSVNPRAPSAPPPRSASARRHLASLSIRARSRSARGDVSPCPARFSSLHDPGLLA